jgi:anti-sigma factor ChrR (cupin superfamily)
LVAAVSVKRQEAAAGLLREWTTLDASLPPLVAAVRVRIDMLTKIKLPRKGIDLSRAKASIAVGDALWDKAESAFESGQLEDAVALIKDAKPKAEAAAAALQLTYPGTD